MMNTLNFTKATLQTLPRPPKGMVAYRDSKEQGLSLYITATGVITFFIRRRVQRRDERIVLGRFPEMSVEGARKAALSRKAEVAQGKNPNLEKRKIRQEITFGELFTRYLNDYSKLRKKSWQYDEREVSKFLSHWLKRQLSTIGKDEVAALHRKIGRENGLYQANRIIERIRAIFNKGIEWGWDGTNPASKILKFKEKSRDRFIQPEEMPFFFQALSQEQSQTIKDYIWLSLLTGARKGNVLAMRWEQVNWELRQWRIPESKNGESLVLPLIDRALDILKERRRKTNSEWVFPSDSTTGHLADPKRAWNRVRLDATVQLLRAQEGLTKLIADTDKEHQETLGAARWLNLLQKKAKEKDITLPVGLMDVHLHDLRRTLGSFQAITGASLQVIGKSLGHKSQAATQIYARLHHDPVRKSVERATEIMFEHGQGLKGSVAV